MGLDLSQHNESAYSLGTIGTAAFGAGLGAAHHREAVAHIPSGGVPSSSPKTPGS